MCLGLAGWFSFPPLASVWVFSIALSPLVYVLNSRFQPRIVQEVNAVKQGPYIGHCRQDKHFGMPKLYIAETGSYGRDGRPILGLYAGEDIQSGR